ncbi:unnamed protein product [Cochlearia groenlandica]
MPQSLLDRVLSLIYTGVISQPTTGASSEAIPKRNTLSIVTTSEAKNRNTVEKPKEKSKKTIKTAAQGVSENAVDFKP